MVHKTRAVLNNAQCITVCCIMLLELDQHVYGLILDVIVVGKQHKTPN